MASIIHIVLGPRMLSQVQIQATFPFQPLATDVAHKVLLHSVFDHVLLQRVLVRASLVTFGTVYNFALALFRDMINLFVLPQGFVDKCARPRLNCRYRRFRPCCR